MASDTGAPRPVIIDAKGGALLRQVKAIWEYRELLYFFVKRELNGRYRASQLGLSWILLRPALEIATYIVVFGYVFRVSTPGLPYPLFLCAGLIPWLLFHQTVSGAAASLAGARHIMSKVYFPRLLVPLTNLTLGLVDFAVLMGIVLALALVLGTIIPWQLLALPAFVAMLIALAFGTSLLVASASVDRPDIDIAMPATLRALMYLSPIVYPPTLVPELVRPYYELNPVAAIVTGIRWSLGAPDAPSSVALVLAALVSIGVLVAGVWVFLHTERRMIDFL